MGAIGSLFRKGWAMADKWYIFVGDHRFGPFSLGELRQFATAGKISPETRLALAESGGDVRQKAGELAGVFPSGDSAQSPPPVVPSKSESGQRQRPKRKRLARALGGGLVVVITCCIIVAGLRWAREEAESLRRKTEVVRTVIAETKTWISSGSIADSDRVEKRIALAQEQGVASEAAALDATVTEFQRVKAERSAARKTERRAQLAEASFQAAKEAIARKDLDKARSCLWDCLSLAWDKELLDKANALKVEMDTATSEPDAVNGLSAMSDSAFSEFQVNGECRENGITDPTLQEIRNATWKRCLPRAVVVRAAAKQRLADEERKIAEQKEAARQEQVLRTRTPDVRKVCWGDSPSIVRQVAERNLQEKPGEVPDSISLEGRISLAGNSMNICYVFYTNKLVEVLIWMDCGPFGNPFDKDGTLRYALEEKYGKGDTVETGMSVGGFDSRGSSRTTTWTLSRQTITLMASSNDPRHHLFLTYKGRTPECDEYDELYEHRQRDSDRKRSEKLKSDL